MRQVGPDGGAQGGFIRSAGAALAFGRCHGRCDAATENTEKSRATSIIQPRGRRTTLVATQEVPYLASDTDQTPKPLISEWLDQRA